MWRETLHQGPFPLPVCQGRRSVLLLKQFMGLHTQRAGDGKDHIQGYSAVSIFILRDSFSDKQQGR